MAEKVVEEVFVDLCQAPRSYDPCEETLRSHLVRHAHKMCLRRAYSEHDLSSRPSETTGSWRDLRPEERVTLALAHFGEMKCDKVGDVLGLPSATVAETIQRALKRLSGDVAGG